MAERKHYCVCTVCGSNRKPAWSSVFIELIGNRTECRKFYKDRLEQRKTDSIEDGRGNYRRLKFFELREVKTAKRRVTK